MLEAGERVEPLTIAAYIINRTDRESGSAMTPLRLQKLLYYVEAWYLANFDQPLFRENFKAWVHGPVLNSVFQKYKRYRWRDIPTQGPVDDQLPADLRNFIDAVCDEYEQFSAKKLEQLTHAEEPWRVARGDRSPEENCDEPIDKLLMRNYYGKRIDKAEIDKLQD